MRRDDGLSPARILVTGSADGLGLIAARQLVDRGHVVVLHARSADRSESARAALPGAEVLVADVSTLAGMRSLAEQANASGRFDGVIHNVGLGHRTTRRTATEDGLSQLWAVNVLAPYVLSVLTERPDRLVYLSSGLASDGDARLEDLQWADRPWDSFQAYCDSKLQDLLLTFGFARRWPSVPCNAVNPGWVATRMGGAGAPDDPEEGGRTQAELAVSGDTTGGYWFHGQRFDPPPAALDVELQDRLLEVCRTISGV